MSSQPVLDPHVTAEADITDFLKDDIKGPASFTCAGQSCKFEEPGMNDLILTFFGDHSITLDCHGGECLHYSQVPGYVVSSHARLSETDLTVSHSPHPNLITPDCSL